MKRVNQEPIQFEHDDLSKYRKEARLRIRDTLSEYAIRHIIGISGGADSDRMLQTEETIEEFVTHFQGGDYAILTGGTEGGVPQLGVEVARRLEVPTIGIFPKQGRKYALLHSLDLAIETSAPDIGDGIFGTETPAFVNMLDGATVIGGGYGTLTEAATILKTNMKRARDRSRGVEGAQEPIYFSPIATTGGAADSAYLIANNLGGDSRSDLGMPPAPTTGGDVAAQFIVTRLEK